MNRRDGMKGIERHYPKRIPRSPRSGDCRGLSDSELACIERKLFDGRLYPNERTDIAWRLFHEVMRRRRTAT